MGLLDGLLVICILGALGWVIYGKIARKNPKVKEVTKDLFNLTDKIPPTLENPDVIERVYDEKRTMM